MACWRRRQCHWVAGMPSSAVWAWVVCLLLLLEEASYPGLWRLDVASVRDCDCRPGFEMYPCSPHLVPIPSFVLERARLVCLNLGLGAEGPAHHSRLLRLLRLL